MKQVAGLFKCWETPYNAVFTAEVGCEARAGLFKYQ